MIPLLANRVTLHQDEDCVEVEGDRIHRNDEPEEPAQLLSGEDPHETDGYRGFSRRETSDSKRLPNDLCVDDLPILEHAQVVGVLPIAVAYRHEHADIVAKDDELSG